MGNSVQLMHMSWLHLARLIVTVWLDVTKAAILQGRLCGLFSCFPFRIEQYEQP